jgi:hypothetical protein
MEPTILTVCPKVVVRSSLNVTATLVAIAQAVLVVAGAKEVEELDMVATTVVEMLVPIDSLGIEDVASRVVELVDDMFATHGPTTPTVGPIILILSKK